MTFYINNEKIDVSLEDEKTVGDILKSFEVMCEQNQAAVIGIKINDKQITADNFDQESALLLTDDMRFDFTIITKDTIRESFSKLSTLFTELSSRMEQIPVDLQCGKIKESHLAIKNLADSIGEFCHIATLSTLFPEYTIVKINDMSFSDFFNDFTPILSDFEEALKNSDTVTVGDLCEYEICPRLQAISKSLEELSCH